MFFNEFKNLILKLKNVTQNYAIFMKAFNTFLMFCKEGKDFGKKKAKEPLE